MIHSRAVDICFYDLLLRRFWKLYSTDIIVEITDPIDLGLTGSSSSYRYWSDGLSPDQS